jgi:hypothetical protein
MKSESSFRLRSFPRTLQALSVAAALAGGVTLALPAAASEPFPAYIAEKYEMPCVPACTLCHLTNLGGATSFRVPGLGFTLLTIANDVTGATIESGVPESMDPNFAAMAAMGTDTDMDGTPDLDELKLGTDPGGSSTPVCDVPKYGCGASVASTAPTRFGALALAASVMLVLGLRRRR